MNVKELISFRKIISSMSTVQLEEKRKFFEERISKMIFMPEEVSKLGVVESVLEERKLSEENVKTIER